MKIDNPISQPMLDLPWRKFALYAGVIVLVRVIALPFLQINIGPDEAQYWVWSQNLDFGYYSKPPFIAWLIAATTIFTDAPWAVRLSSPIMHGATAALIFATAGRLYGARAAMWSGLLWLTLPAVTLSSSLITTDMPLLFFWSLGLFAFTRLAESDGRDWRYGALLGLALGFGFLSKYALIYFPLGMGFAFLVSPFARRALKLKPLVIAFAIFLLLISPNIWWNMAHDFQTVSHTADNANLGADKFNLDEMLDFISGQFGLAGPFIFGGFIWGLVTIGRRLAQAGEDRAKDLMLLCFALPALIFITIMAYISRAHANWAVSAYPALLILVSVWILRTHKLWSLKTSLMLHGGIAVLFLTLASNFALLDAMGRSNDIKRVRGWESQSQEIAALTKNYPALLVDDRELMGSLLYYLRDSDKPIMAWDLNRRTDNYYEATFAYDPKAYPIVALIAKYPRQINQYVEFDTILPVATSSMDLGIKCPRVFEIYEMRDYRAREPLQLPPALENAGLRDDGCKPY